MAEHKHGTMDITAQEKTFAGFVTFSTRAVIVILVAVVLLALMNA
jgi:Bacterial aa3 type cytochrome c oxidase subunit IV